MNAFGDAFRPFSWMYLAFHERSFFHSAVRFPGYFGSFIQLRNAGPMDCLLGHRNQTASLNFLMVPRNSFIIADELEALVSPPTKFWASSRISSMVTSFPLSLRIS